MKILMFLWLAILPVQALELVTVKSDQTLWEDNGRSHFGKLEKGREQIKAGRHALVLFQEKGRAALLFIGKGEGQGYLPEDQLKDSRPAVSVASLTDPEGQVNLRSGPGETSPVLRALPVSSRVFVLKEGPWCQVETDQGESGYIAANRLRIQQVDTADDEDKRALVKAVVAYMRKGPDPLPTIRSEIFCGSLVYFVDPKTGKMESHRSAFGTPGRIGNWAAIIGNDRRSDGGWQYFGPFPHWLFERTGGRWVYRGELGERFYPAKGFDVASVPAEVVRGLNLNLTKKVLGR